MISTSQRFSDWFNPSHSPEGAPFPAEPALATSRILPHIREGMAAARRALGASVGLWPPARFYDRTYFQQAGAGKIGQHAYDEGFRFEHDCAIDAMCALLNQTQRERDQAHD